MAWFTYSGISLNISQDSIWTAFYYEDRGDGTQDWVSRIKAFDGNIVSLGAKGDGAVTNPASAASLISVAKGIMTVEGQTADAAVEGGATAGSLVALLKGLQKALGINTDSSVPTGNGYINGILKAIRDNLRTRVPSDATFVNATSGNVAAGSAAAALPATSGKTNYVTGIEITGAGATAASNVIATLTGLLTANHNYIVTAPAGITTPITPIIVQFDPPLPASAANTAITVTLPSLGAGNTHACVNIHGYRI